MTNLQPLLDRLEAATGPDRELDAAIGAAFRIGSANDPPAWVTNWDGPFQSHPRWPGKVALVHSDGSVGMHWSAQPYTASLDAALALVERELGPDIKWWLVKDGQTIRAGFTDPNCFTAPVDVEGHTAPLALLIALCRALASEQA